MDQMTFLDRLRYGKHTFTGGIRAYAKPHINPDGTVGGWVADTALVEPTCYISPNAEVYEYAQVRDNAQLLETATVNGFAKVMEDAVIDGGWVTDDSVVQGDTYVGDYTIVCGSSYADHGKLLEYMIYDDIKKVRK